jgi:hypothetical protein
MNRHSDANGITLVELLVVLAVLYFLFLVLWSLQRTRAIDHRMPCGTNLFGIGKAMLLYSNDYQDEFPRAGGGRSVWTGRVADWQAKDRKAAYGLDPNCAGGQVSISASLYLLVKYTEVTPRSFMCPGDRGVKEFTLETNRRRDDKSALIDLWDFGPDPSKHCSFAYQMLYGGHALTVSSEPGFAIAADRNPWMDEKRVRSFPHFKPPVDPLQSTPEQNRLGNALAHKGDGQNVLFLDTHVEFKRQSCCSLENDNIYTSWDGADKIRGRPPKLGSRPADAKDSLLVNDPPAARK